MKINLWYATTAAAVLFLGNANAQSYTFKDLNQSAWYSKATAISNSREIVGEAYAGSIEGAHATLWKGSNMIDLAGGRSSTASAVNSNGQIAGKFPTSRGDDTAAVWNTSGGAPKLFPVPAATSGALAINNNGQLAGWTFAADYHNHATIWNNGTATFLTTLGGTESFANGINDRGLAVGYSSLSGNLETHATLWDGKGVTDLGTLGGNFGMAQAINNAGQVVGASSRSINGNRHATLWDNGAITDLGTLGGDIAWASALNNHGQIVGTSYLAGPENFQAGHATLWEGGKIIDLNQFIDSNAAAEGWVLTHAWGVNDRGDIVGEALNMQTYITHAFVLTVSAVPEPATYAMLMLGLGFMAWTSRLRKK